MYIYKTRIIDVHNQASEPKEKTMNTEKAIRKADKVATRMKTGMGTGHKGCWKQVASKAERRLNKVFVEAYYDDEP